MRAMVLASVCAMVTGGPALAAEGIPWGFVEAGYNNVDVDSADDDGDGWFVGASAGILKSIHIFGRYSDASTDDLDLDVTRWAVGGGWHGLLGEQADIFADAAYVDAEYGPGSDEGYFARGGVRWRPIDLFELGANARWEDLGDLDDDVIWEGTAIVHVWRIGIGVNFEAADEIDTYTAFGRFHF